MFSYSKSDRGGSDQVTAFWLQTYSIRANVSLFAIHLRTGSKALLDTYVSAVKCSYHWELNQLSPSHRHSRNLCAFSIQHWFLVVCSILCQSGTTSYLFRSLAVTILYWLADSRKRKCWRGSVFVKNLTIQCQVHLSEIAISLASWPLQSSAPWGIWVPVFSSCVRLLRFLSPSCLTSEYQLTSSKWLKKKAVESNMLTLLHCPSHCYTDPSISSVPGTF